MIAKRFRSTFDELNIEGIRNYGPCQKCGHSHQPLKRYMDQLLCIFCYNINTKVVTPGLKKRVFEMKENDNWREILAWENRPPSPIPSDI